MWTYLPDDMPNRSSQPASRQPGWRVINWRWRGEETCCLTLSVDLIGWTSNSNPDTAAYAIIVPFLAHAGRAFSTHGCLELLRVSMIREWFRTANERRTTFASSHREGPRRAKPIKPIESIGAGAAWECSRSTPTIRNDWHGSDRAGHFPPSADARALVSPMNVNRRLLDALGNADAMPIDQLPALPAGEQQNADHQE